MKTSLKLLLSVLLCLAIFPWHSAQASDSNINGTFTGAYTETFTNIFCDPNNAPVTMTGSVEVTGLNPGYAIMFGPVDKGLIDSGDSGWGSGAYAYFGYIGSNIRVGPSDGFLGGELNQTGANVPYVAGGPNEIAFTATIYDGEITVTYNGTDYIDTYGDIEDANAPDAYPGGEFDNGAYFAINLFDSDGSVDYDITISGCAQYDGEGPLTTNVIVDPNPAAVDSNVTLAATVDDTDTGHSSIASAEYSVAGGPWLPMNATDGTFDMVSEDVTADFLAPDTPGIYNVCVRGTDLRDPATNTLFLDTFDSQPELANSQTADVWYPDRYAPSAFESVSFDGDNRLHVAISASDYLPYGSTFYNFQGRKFDLGNEWGTYITADLYIGPDWETENRHASLWATTYDLGGNISGYPIAGFTQGTGFRIFTQDTDQDPSNGYQPGWYDIGYPASFSYGAWYTIRAELTNDVYRYYINDELVWSDTITFGSVQWANLMLQAYNYGEDYDVYWDNVGAGVMDGNTGPAECTMLVVYDPSAGFVTGGGWFMSPSTAIPPGIVRDGVAFDDRWVFNAEPPYVTPAGFTDDEASTGSGSLHVEPITNAAGNDAKFILRYVPDTEILLSDLDSFSIDFLIDDAGTNYSANQFYVNLYTLTPDPNDGGWYDCRFDYVATTGSITDWTALAFDSSTSATAVGDKLGGTCPSSFDDMPSGSTVLFLSVNLGDTSGNDTGVGGYFDNAWMSVAGATTSWDLGEGLVGRANFGFVAKYKKGQQTPDGNTEFVFKTADLNFHSTEYEWLIVNQGGQNAQFKGSGTINGDTAPNGEDYRFMIWASDDDPDTFRIKIWWDDDGTEQVIYDNGGQELGGGNIVIHKGK